METDHRCLRDDHHYVAIVSVPARALLAFLTDRFLPGRGLPPFDGHIHVLGLHFHGVADPAQFLGGDQLGAADQERFVADVSHLGVELDGPQEQFQRFLGWVDIHAGTLLV